MGKLNYAARKTEGIKAGQTVSKDLRKRIPPGTSSKTAARDPYLEIDLTGKGLTDDGFSEFIDDLIACLDFRGDDHPEGVVKLTELSLKGNKLTVASLGKLGKVIARSHADLKDLDISENQIIVDKVEQATIWKEFLDSFQGCFVLKRIDFSGNELGARGFELLCRAYMQSDLDFVEPLYDDALENSSGENVEGEAALQETMNSLSLGSGKENARPNADPNKGGKSKAMRPARTIFAPAVSSRVEAKRFACTRGLRSVPYLIFINVGLTNACAFHLSVILLAHRLPEALLTFLPHGKPVAPAQGEYDDQCQGVIYLPNEKLERHGRRLIELAETNRQKVIETESADSDSDGSLNQETTPGTAIPGHYSPHANWGRERGTKRREMRKQHQTNLERSKKLLLLDVLKADGVHSVELWSVAFKMMVVSRALLLKNESRPGKESTEISEEGKALKKIPAAEGSKGPILSKVPPGYFEKSNPPQLFTPGWDDFEINFPAIQKSAPVPSAPAKPTVDPCTPETTSRHGKKKSYSNIHSRSAPAGPSTTSTRELSRFGLPMEIWRVIIADAVGANGILSKEQQMTVMRYASDWNALEQEISVQGAAENQQIWKILETVGCLAYTSMP